MLAARATIKSQYYYRDLCIVCRPSACGKMRSFLEDDGNPCTRYVQKGEKSREREQDTSGPMAIITGPLDGEIQMQVIGAPYCIAMAPGSRSAFPFRRSPMRSSIVPCARRNLRKAPNLGR